MEKPQSMVGIVMGSRSDTDIMQKAADQLSEFGIGFEVETLSAHRNPKKTAEYAQNAASRGLKVIIAGAGLSAALPGVIAAHTTLPVIGVPIASGTLGGFDSLLSIVQMPPGVPVATVGINNARNAAILAVEIIAISDSIVAEKVADFKRRMAE